MWGKISQNPFVPGAPYWQAFPSDGALPPFGTNPMTTLPGQCTGQVPMSREPVDAVEPCQKN